MDPNAAKDGPSIAVDRLKGILILLIVIGHNGLITSAYDDFRRMLYLFHVQSFFLLSACLSKGLPDRRKLVDKLLRYEIPYLAFLVLYAVVFTVVLRRGAGLRELPLGLVRCVVAPTEASLKSVAGVSMLWFLPALISFTLFDTALRRWAGALVPAVAAVVHVALALLPDTLPGGVPWFVRTAAFLLFPAACARAVWGRVAPGALFWPAAAAAVVSGAALFRTGATFRVASLDLPALLVQDAFLLAAFLALFAAPLPAGVSRALALLGRESFVIYLCHTLIFYGLLAVLRVDDGAGWRMGVGILVATIALSLVAGRVIAATPRLRSALFPSGWADFRSAFAPRRGA